MIIQNLHKKLKEKKVKNKDKKLLLKTTLFFIFFLSSFLLNAQDNISHSLEVEEKNSLLFQENFFKALSHKAIFNYQKAILFLEKCDELLPNNKATLFELSKNYYKLSKYNQALEYVNSALKIESDNLWLQEHKVAILRRMANFDDAILVQQKIADKYPKKKQYLVFLHLQNNDILNSKKIIKELKIAKLLNSRLRRIDEKLNAPKKQINKPKIEITNTNLEASFKKEKSFKFLKPLLKKLALNNDSNLLKYSEQGLALFPAQPYVYLMSGKAFNNNKQHKKALESLQNGIDFVIDNNEIEAKFYIEMAEAYKGLKNIKKANLYKNKAAKILK